MVDELLTDLISLLSVSSFDRETEEEGLFCWREEDFPVVKPAIASCSKMALTVVFKNGSTSKYA